MRATDLQREALGEEGRDVSPIVEELTYHGRTDVGKSLGGGQENCLHIRYMTIEVRQGTLVLHVRATTHATQESLYLELLC